MGLNEKFFKSAAPAAGSDYFNTVLYTGNGYPNSGTQPITGVGFKPDLVFIKARNTTAYPAMVDVIRGNLKYLYPNVTLAQATQNGTGFLTFEFILVQISFFVRDLSFGQAWHFCRGS